MTSLPRWLAWLLMLAVLGIVCLCAGLFIPIEASADSGREEILARSQAEVNERVNDGWTYTGTVRFWGGTRYVLERETLAALLWRIETHVLDQGKEQADGTWTLTRADMNQFTVMMDAARRRAARMEDR